MNRPQQCNKNKIHPKDRDADNCFCWRKCSDRGDKLGRRDIAALVDQHGELIPNQGSDRNTNAENPDDLKYLMI